jgi:hypothetical protein
VIRRNRKISRQRVTVRLRLHFGGDVQQHAAPKDGRDSVDTELAESAVIALHGRGLNPAVQLSVAGEVAERIDVRAHMSAERNGIRRGAGVAFPQHVAVFACEAEQIRRMRREMRHAHEVGLRQIVNRVPPDQIKQFAHRRRPSACVLVAWRMRALAGLTGASFAAQRPKL